MNARDNIRYLFCEQSVAWVCHNYILKKKKKKKKSQLRFLRFRKKKVIWRVDKKLIWVVDKKVIWVVGKEVIWVVGKEVIWVVLFFYRRNLLHCLANG